MPSLHRISKCVECDSYYRRFIIHYKEIRFEENDPILILSEAYPIKSGKGKWIFPFSRFFCERGRAIYPYHNNVYQLFGLNFLSYSNKYLAISGSLKSTLSLPVSIFRIVSLSSSVSSKSAISKLLAIRSL